MARPLSKPRVPARIRRAEWIEHMTNGAPDTPEDALDRLEEALMLDGFLNEQFTPREVWILQRRFGLDGYEDATYAALAQALRVSETTVAYVERRALREIRMAARRQWPLPTRPESHTGTMWQDRRVQWAGRTIRGITAETPPSPPRPPSAPDKVRVRVSATKKLPRTAIVHLRYGTRANRARCARTATVARTVTAAQADLITCTRCLPLVYGQEFRPRRIHFVRFADGLFWHSPSCWSTQINGGETIAKWKERIDKLTTTDDPTAVTCAACLVDIRASWPQLSPQL